MDGLLMSRKVTGWFTVGRDVEETKREERREKVKGD